MFDALIPKLRERNIRTLAEAARACRTLTKVLDAHHRAGWSTPMADTAGESARIDSYPYRHRAGDLMAPARFIGPDASVGAALDAMTAAKISSLFVAPPGPALPQHTGIITERDILRALARGRTGALALPVTDAMSRPLATVPADAFAYLAVSRMNRLKVRHLGVTDETGRVTGALSARDLLRAARRRRRAARRPHRSGAGRQRSRERLGGSRRRSRPASRAKACRAARSRP